MQAQILFDNVLHCLTVLIIIIVLTSIFLFPFPDCSIQCSTRWKLRDHVRTHTQEKLIACPQCGALFSNNTKFQDHLNRQFIPADSPHCCTICSKRFTSDRLLKQHVRKHVNTQKCPYCAMTCTSRSSLTYHIAYRHSRGKPHECPLCQKKYKTQYSLSDHLESHQDRVIPCLQQGTVYLLDMYVQYMCSVLSVYVHVFGTECICTCVQY